MYIYVYVYILLRQRKKFDNRYSRRIERMKRIYRPIGFNNLMYIYISNKALDFRSMTNLKKLFNGKNVVR